VNHNSVSQARIEITYHDYKKIQAKLFVQKLPTWKSKLKFDGDAWEGPATDMLDMINSVYDLDESFRLSDKTKLETYQ
jgi:hypothetical protein